MAPGGGRLGPGRRRLLALELGLLLTGVQTARTEPAKPAFGADDPSASDWAAWRSRIDEELASESVALATVPRVLSARAGIATREDTAGGSTWYEYPLLRVPAASRGNALSKLRELEQKKPFDCEDTKLATGGTGRVCRFVRAREQTRVRCSLNEAAAEARGDAEEEVASSVTLEREQHPLCVPEAWDQALGQERRIKVWHVAEAMFDGDGKYLFTARNTEPLAVSSGGVLFATFLGSVGVSTRHGCCSSGTIGGLDFVCRAGSTCDFAKAAARARQEIGRELRSAEFSGAQPCPPLAATEICVRRAELKSIVLGHPFYEDLQVVTSVAPLASSVEVSARYFVLIKRNINSPSLGEPDAVQLHRYERAIRAALDRGLTKACSAAGGTLTGANTCTLP